MGADFKPEVLAPAGGMESIYAAVRCGADGIYAGGKKFSARANAVNLSDGELREAVEYCHLHGVKLYRAMNTVIFDSEAEEFLECVRYSAEIGVDGLIIQDIGGLCLARAAVPHMPLHCSTQMTVHTPLGAKAVRDMGMCRIVPARELTLQQIRAICGTGVETEVFVHGAQCMCLSGQCYMSAVIGSRSANRGQCAQACRLPFSAGGASDDEYALSLKDMSLIEHTAELTEAGCASFKIEGRMKRPEYTAAAVTALRHAVDGEPDSEDMRRLEAVFSRSGFTDGYLTGRLGRDMFGYRRKEDVTAAENVLPRLKALYEKERISGVIDLRFEAKAGERSRLDFSCGEISGSVTGAIPEAAINRPLTPEDAAARLSKLGGTRYRAGKVTAEIGEGLTLPAAEINRLRREAVRLADELTIKKNTPAYDIIRADIKKPLGEQHDGSLKMRMAVSSADTANLLTPADADMFIIPHFVCAGLRNDDIIGMTAVRLPDIVTDEDKLLSDIVKLRERGFSHFVCGNLTHMGVLREMKDITIHGGTGLNITNSFAAEQLARMGFADITASFELRAAQFADLEKVIPTGFYAYGRLPLMIVKNCPVKARTGCGKCAGQINDRTGRKFPVECDEKKYARILNCDILETSDKLSGFTGAAFAVIDTGRMPYDAAKAAADRYRRGGKPTGKYTRGLYYRGII